MGGADSQPSSPVEPAPPTRAEVDCLLALFRLQACAPAAAADQPVASGDLARALGVAAPTATVTLHRLARRGLVDHQPYHGVRLTAEGRRLGGLALRRHRLIETFLVRTLGVDWTVVHQEAARLEHGVSPALLERIDAHLGHPRSDPHGDPIPDADGAVEQGSALPLPACAVGSDLVLVRILGHDPDTFAFLDRHGLAPGASLRVPAAEPAAGVLTVAVAGSAPVPLSTALAARLLCREAGAGAD